MERLGRKDAISCQKREGKAILSSVWGLQEKRIKDLIRKGFVLSQKREEENVHLIGKFGVAHS